MVFPGSFFNFSVGKLLLHAYDGGENLMSVISVSFIEERLNHRQQLIGVSFTARAVSAMITPIRDNSGERFFPDYRISTEIKPSFT